MKSPNAHTTRESWLNAAIDIFRTYFDKLGYTLPEKIRCAIAFTSTGKRAKVAGECWHPPASADQHFEIFIRADKAEPVEVLGELAHQLVHTLLPIEAKHGKDFRGIALRVGLEGKMRHALPGPVLTERLNAIAASLGPLPHAKLDFLGSSDKPKKQTTRMLKAKCPKCEYVVRVAAVHIKDGLPICPKPDHGAFICDLPDEEIIANSEAE